MTEPLLSICVHEHPPSPNDRLHYMARWRRCTRLLNEVAWQCKGTPRVKGVAHVRIRLVYARGRFKDYDNAVASCKPLIDSLVVGGVLADDSPEHITLDVTQEKGAARYCLIEVWPPKSDGQKGEI